MEYQFQTGTLLLLIAAVVAMLTRRLKLPSALASWWQEYFLRCCRLRLTSN